VHYPPESVNQLAMFSLQKVFSKDNSFFDLMEASALEASQSIEALNQLLASPNALPSLKAFHQRKETDKKITEQINEALIGAFVTEIDREDIEMLSSALYKIPKTVEKFAERFIISARLVKEIDFNPHIRILEVATKQVVEMVKQIRIRVSVEQIKAMNAVLQKVEGEADELILQILEDLYSDRHPPTKVLALKDLYELLEKIVDRCRDTGNVVTHIILKHA
jgi:uncharacterized protein Yka (UPF0111/DUF47 family)